MMHEANLSNAFNKEMNALFIILLVFDLSIFLRIVGLFFDVLVIKFGKPTICEDIHGHNCYCYEDLFSQILFDQVTQYIYDFIPIMSILLFHRKNFKIKNIVGELYEELSDSVVDESAMQVTNIDDRSDSELTNEDVIRSAIIRSYRKL